MTRRRPAPAALAAALAAVLALVVGCGPAGTTGAPTSSAPSPASKAPSAAAPSRTPAATIPTGTVAGAPERPTGPTEDAALLVVVDGDTLRVLVAGREERLRIIGIDTPEPNPGEVETPEPFAAEATAATAALLAAGGRLVLERDVSERDRFGRLLRHAWLEDDGRWTLLSLVLVAGGYAQVSTFPPDVKYADVLRAAQREARDAARGLWGVTP